MPDSSRDREIVAHIYRYCEQIEVAHEDFGRSRERFDRSTTYGNTAQTGGMSGGAFSAMHILQFS